MPPWKNASKAAATLANGRQAKIIASISTGIPFTVYDGADVLPAGQRAGGHQSANGLVNRRLASVAPGDDLRHSGNGASDGRKYHYGFLPTGYRIVRHDTRYFL
jgi:hypothetical protein